MFQQFLPVGVNKGKRLDREKAKEHCEIVALVTECKAGLQSHRAGPQEWEAAPLSSRLKSLGPKSTSTGSAKAGQGGLSRAGGA